MNEQELIREARRKYRAEWRKKNPDKVKATFDRFYMKKAMQALQVENNKTEAEAGVENE